MFTAMRRLGQELVVALALTGQGDPTVPQQPSKPDQTPRVGKLDAVASPSAPPHDRDETRRILASLTTTDTPNNWPGNGNHYITQPTPRRMPAQQNPRVNLEDPQVQKLLKNLNPEQPATLQAIPASYLEDRDFLLAAARKAPEIMKQADQKFLADPDFLFDVIVERNKGFTLYHHGALAVLKERQSELLKDLNFLRRLSKESVNPLRWADESVRTSRHLFEEVVENAAPLLISDFAPSFWEDRDLIIKAFEKCSVFEGKGTRFVDCVPKEILKQIDFWKLVARTNPELLEHAPEELKLWTDPSTTEALIIASEGSAYEFSPNHVKENPTFARIAVRLTLSAVRSIPQKLLNDQHFIASLLEHRGEIFEFLPTANKQQPKLILAAVAGRAGMLAEVPDLKDVLARNPGLAEQIAKTSFNTRPILEKALGTLPSEVAKAYDNTRRELERFGFSEATLNSAGRTNLGPSAANRGRLDRIEEMLEARRKAEEFEFNRSWDRRPSVAVILPHGDYSEAFIQGALQPDFDRLFEGHRVVVYECKDGAAFAAATRELAMNGGVDYLVVAAHGYPHALSFGSQDVGPTGTVVKRDGILSVQDTAILKSLAPKAVRAGGRVVLASCSTGRPNGEDPNIAQSLNAVWPHASLTAPGDVAIPPTLVDRISGHFHPDVKFLGPDYQPIPAVTIPAGSPPFEVQLEGALRPDDYYRRFAAADVLSRSHYPLVARHRPAGDMTFTELTDPRGRVLYRFDRPLAGTGGREPLTQEELQEELPARLLLESVRQVLETPTAVGLAKHWNFPENHPLYVTPSDPRLVDLKRQLAGALAPSLSPADLRLGLKPGAEGIIDVAEISIGGVEVVRYVGRDTNLGWVNLAVLGEHLFRKRPQ